MSLPHFFLEEQVFSQETNPVFELDLSADDRKHFNALRLNAREHIAVIDAACCYYECEIDSVSRDQVLVSVSKHLDSKSRPNITLIQGLAKGDKMDSVFCHATEIGVRAFLPLICNRSIVKLDEKKKASRLKRWNALVKSAAMQSGQSSLPHIYEPTTIDQARDVFSSFDVVVVFWEEAGIDRSVDRVLSNYKCSGKELSSLSVGIVIGPEGGLSEDEINRIGSFNSHVELATLGSSILRTETAGLIAPALVLFELERA